MEAAAISELYDNTKDDEGFEIPTIHWPQTARNVMVTSWMDGIPIRDHEAIDKAGLDRKKNRKGADAALFAPCNPGRVFPRGYAPGQPVC